MTKIINKLWGKEEWLELNEKYCYKRIYINKGYKTSYQYHNYKRETNYLIEGTAEIWLENDDGVVEKKIMKAGEFFNVTPPKKHRVIALTDIILQEVFFIMLLKNLIFVKRLMTQINQMMMKDWL